MPARLKKAETDRRTRANLAQQPEPEPPPPIDLRKAVWDFIAARAATLSNGGVRVGEVTSAVTPWPHQVRAFHRMYDNWPPKLLIADEVGLGKTVQAGCCCGRHGWPDGAKRILILAPKNVCSQWQIELREKFNLNWPIYDGQKLNWYPSPRCGPDRAVVSREDWHRSRSSSRPAISSGALTGRRNYSKRPSPWDLVILDEAHHARRRGAGSTSESGPNALLRLMRGLQGRTQGLVLLTATPMQVHPVEVFDLLSLLGLPPEWTQQAFLRFFDEVLQDNPSHEAFDRSGRHVPRGGEHLWRGPVDRDAADRDHSTLRAKTCPGRCEIGPARPAANWRPPTGRRRFRLMRLHTPINRLISRHTRACCGAISRKGRSRHQSRIGMVEDRFIDLSPDERALYEAVEDYISTTYNQATARAAKRNRFRHDDLSSAAGEQLLRSGTNTRNSPAGDTTKQRCEFTARPRRERLTEGAEGDEPDADEASKLEQAALALEEKSEIERLLPMIRRLPPDTKAERLRDDYRQASRAGL